VHFKARGEDPLGRRFEVLYGNSENSGARNLRKFVAGPKIRGMQRPSWVLVFLVLCFALRFDPPRRG